MVPELLDDENDDMIRALREGKYNLRRNPTPNFTDENRY